MGPSFSYIGYSPLKGSREESNTQLILINGRKMVASCMDIATRFARERQLTSSFQFMAIAITKMKYILFEFEIDISIFPRQMSSSHKPFGILDVFFKTVGIPIGYQLYPSSR